MKAYRVLWLTLCGVLGVLGVGTAFILSVPRMLVLFGLAAVAAAALTRRISLGYDRTKEPVQDLMRLMGTNAIVGGAAVVAVVGLGAMVGAWAWLLVALLAGASPYAIRWCDDRLRQLGWRSPRPWRDQDSRTQPEAEVEPVPVPVPVPEPAAEPRSMSDAELCDAWRATFTALQRASSLTQRVRIVEARRVFLDELERRNPRGLTAWLASGARAAGDPSRFVVGNAGAGRHHIDWDGLIHGQDR